MKRFTVCLILLVLFVVVSQASAQTVIPTPTQQPIEYALAYPGLLPDSPLYKIKAFRDWLVSMLIADPGKKVSFDVLQADKRLGAAEMLLEENPPRKALAIETLSKGENYFFQAIEQMELAKKQGASTYDMLQKLRLSSAKHLEVVTQLEQGATGILLQGLKVQEKRIREFENTVAKEGPK